MNTKEIKITVPEGYEIDKENSTFECVKFKKKGLTYEDICPKVLGMRFYCIDTCGNVGPFCLHPEEGDYKRIWYHPNNAKTKEQLQRLLALNKLMNVAEYLNEGWEPDWSISFRKWYIYYDHNVKSLMVECNQAHQHSSVYFQSKELAKQAIDILGEEEVKLALGV